MDKYVCTVCGYVYDPEKGDPKIISPPAPLCRPAGRLGLPGLRVGKDEFEKEN